ncbi:MAG: glucose 1-dehydrogenase [Oscillospiraceae bacterium]|nr:glucose 1-dehydrogenase [Oscillospiraceae bacterium]
MNNLFDLSNKTAIVTGGSRGLGLAISLGLAECGANIATVSREASAELENNISKFGTQVKSYTLDLQNFDGYDDFISRVLSDFGSIDILVNNAGVQRRHPVLEFPPNDFDFVLDVNLKAPFLLCQKAAKVMIDKGYGKIINIASLLSFQGGLTVPAYTASKSAVLGFTKAMSNEWAKLGINVNCIAPGYFATDMNEALLADENRNRQILERIPKGRWGTPEDIAGAAIFLASKASDYISGTTIVVDGGWMGR